MGCLVALVARVGLIAVWATTPLVSRAFNGSWLLPLLGLIFLPITTLAYVLVYIPGSGLTGWGWFAIALGFLLDLMAHSYGVYSGRRRIARYRTS